jgi:hypothetical protein
VLEILANLDAIDKLALFFQEATHHEVEIVPMAREADIS